MRSEMDWSILGILPVLIPIIIFGIFSLANGYRNDFSKCGDKEICKHSICCKCGNKN